MAQRTVLITGATSGIGKACAQRFAALHDRLILTGRRNDRLLKLGEELKENHGTEVITLAFDIRHINQVNAAFAKLPESWKDVDILINNAGLAAGLNFIHQGDMEDWETMIDTNVKGLLYITRIVAPLMVERKRGHIINIGSIAGKEVYPKGNVYCATKYAVDALTKGLRIDLLPFGIRVTQVCPGAADTEFSEVRFKGDKQKAADVYKGFTPLSGDDVAEAIVWVTGLPGHVNVNDMLLMPTAQAGPAYVHKT